MPSINLAELRLRTQELAGRLADAPAFRAGVRALMETHAHRLLRRGPSMAQRGALQAWDVPGLLMRELESTLLPAAAADPAAALAVADLLWVDGRLEERLLAARLASASTDTDALRERVARWTDGLTDPILQREIADETCRPLRRANTTHFRADSRRWIESDLAATRRFGWMALRGWLTDGGAASTLSIFDLLPRALRETDPETQRIAAEILSNLAGISPAETQKWLEDLPQDLLQHGRVFLQTALPALPEEFADWIRNQYLRPE